MTEDTKQGALGTPSNEDTILAPTVAAMMGISYDSLRSYRANARRETPPPLGKRGSNYVWSRRQVEAWIAARDTRAEG